MEIGTILDLLHACHQFNTFLTALQHLASYMYCVGILGLEDHSWQECSTSSDVMYSEEAEVRFERSFSVQRGAEDLFFSALRSHLEVAVNDVTIHTFHANTKPAESNQILPSMIVQIR